MTYPEHEKLELIKDKSQVVSEFLEWLSEEKRLVISKWGRDGYDEGTLYMYPMSKQDLLAQFFNIDLDKLENEKRAMLDAIRAASNAG